MAPCTGLPTPVWHSQNTLKPLYTQSVRTGQERITASQPHQEVLAYALPLPAAVASQNAAFSATARPYWTGREV